MDLRVSEANGYAERELAFDMLSEHVERRATVGADRGDDTRDFVAGCRELEVTPHADAPPSTGGRRGTRATH